MPLRLFVTFHPEVVSNVDLHSYIDLASIVGLFASAIVASLLGARLARHDAQQKEFGEVKTRVERIAGWIAGKFGIQL